MAMQLRSGNRTSLTSGTPAILGHAPMALMLRMRHGISLELHESTTLYEVSDLTIA